MNKLKSVRLPKKIFGVTLGSPRRAAAEPVAARRERAVSEPVVDTNVSVLTVNEFIGRKKRPRPTEPEFIAYARYLGIDTVQDVDLLWVAEEALFAPLPEDWTEHFDSDGRVFYYNMQMRRSSWLHPLEQLHRDLYTEISRFRRASLSAEEKTTGLATWRRRCEQAEFDSQEELEAWTQHVDEEGKTFFFNRQERRSAWTDPRCFRCHVLRLQMKALRVLSAHCGLELPSSSDQDEWAELDITSLALLDEPVPDEREEQLMPYSSPRPRALHLLGGTCLGASSSASPRGCSSSSPASPRSDAGEVDAEKADRMAAGECVVCLDANATHIVVPCGHQALCRNCAERYFKVMPAPSGRLRCPCCRRHIEQVIEVFVPKPRFIDVAATLNTTQSL